MKLLFLIAFTGVILLSCKDKGSTETSAAQTQSVKTDTAKDSAEIRNVITGFYNWYNKNYTKLMKYDLYSGIKKEDAPPYKINWKEVERYQQFIRDSIPQLGDEFLAEQKRFFARADSAFKKDAEDEIPYGFDYDWYTNSQEDPQYTTDQVNGNTPWLIEIEGDNAKVKILASYEEKDILLAIQMKKENGRWTIARIGENY